MIMVLGALYTFKVCCWLAHCSCVGLFEGFAVCVSKYLVDIWCIRERTWEPKKKPKTSITISSRLQSNRQADDIETKGNFDWINFVLWPSVKNETVKIKWVQCKWGICANARSLHGTNEWSKLKRKAKMWHSVSGIVFDTQFAVKM